MESRKNILNCDKMSIESSSWKTKTKTEYELILSYRCDICDKKVKNKEVVCYESINMKSNHIGNLEMCQKCSKNI